VVACVRLDQLVLMMQAGLEQGSLIWLIGAEAAARQYAALPGAALPADPRVLLRSREHGVIARARDGALISYASQLLPGGLLVLAGYRAEADLAHARHVLVTRLAILAVLLGIGFLLTGAGIHQYMVRPLKDLAAAVRRWRGGGVFAAAMPAGVPTEVAELSLAFRDATARLAEREAQVRAALETRDLVMQEIHHRVKNNLQIVASLLNLQAGRIRQPEARAEFLSARNRVRALATLHRHLYTQGDLHRINMRSFLTELCGQLFEAMGETEGDRIRLSIEATELEMASDQAVPLALIVTETVSNALKYAFPRPRRGHVRVVLATEDAGTARLTVEDDGVGLPAGQSETDTGTRDGLGIQLIRGFARQIGATLEVTENQGTCYSLRIPLHALEAPAA
jgi:two-component sensor histidine kinase